MKNSIKKTSKGFFKIRDKNTPRWLRRFRFRNLESGMFVYSFYILDWTTANMDGGFNKHHFLNLLMKLGDTYVINIDFFDLDYKFNVTPRLKGLVEEI